MRRRRTLLKRLPHQASSSRGWRSSNLQGRLQRQGQRQDRQGRCKRASATVADGDAVEGDVPTAVAVAMELVVWICWQNGKANLFAAPQQLSALQALFQQPGGFFSTVPAEKGVPRKVVSTMMPKFTDENKYGALCNEHDEDGDNEKDEEGRVKIEVKIADIIKPAKESQRKINNEVKKAKDKPALNTPSEGPKE